VALKQHLDERYPMNRLLFLALIMSSLSATHDDTYPTENASRRPRVSTIAITVLGAAIVVISGYCILEFFLIQKQTDQIYYGSPYLESLKTPRGMRRCWSNGCSYFVKEVS
jgi:hypothetical protein